MDYKAEYGDDASDRRSDYFKESLELLKEHIDKCRKDQEKYKKEKPNQYCAGVWDYTIIGLVNPVIEMIINSDNAWCLYKNTDLFDILDECINNCENDPTFFDGWKDVSELHKAINYYKKQVEKYRKTIEQKFNK